MSSLLVSPQKVDLNNMPSPNFDALTDCTVFVFKIKTTNDRTPV